MTEANARQNVTFPSNGAQAHGYLTKPDSGSGPGLILVQEWWGLDDHMVELADRFAAEGFVVLCPDLYGGRVAHAVDDAAAMLHQLPVDRAARDLGGAVDRLLDDPDVTSAKVGIAGFCMGGGFALHLAVQQGERIAAVVPFYGVGPGLPDNFEGLIAAVQGHYGEKDQSYPVAQARQLEQRLGEQTPGPIEFFYYPAGHAFLNDRNLLGTYDPDNAKLAWQRAVEFLKHHVS
jgi:carboxymethylenebutenolidase